MLKAYQLCLDKELKGCYFPLAEEEVILDLNTTYIRDVCDYWSQKETSTIDPSATTDPNAGESTEIPDGGPGIV